MTDPILIGKSETKQVWAVIDGEDVTYFYADEVDGERAEFLAGEYASETGGRVACVTLRTEIIAYEFQDEEGGK